MLQIEDYFAARMISAETLKRNRVMQKRIGDEVLTNSLLNLLLFKIFSCQSLKEMLLGSHCSILIAIVSFCAADCNCFYLLAKRGACELQVPLSN